MLVVLVPQFGATNMRWWLPTGVKRLVNAPMVSQWWMIRWTDLSKLFVSWLWNYRVMNAFVSLLTKKIGETTTTCACMILLRFSSVDQHSGHNEFVGQFQIVTTVATKFWGIASKNNLVISFLAGLSQLPWLPSVWQLLSVSLRFSRKYDLLDVVRLTDCRARLS